MKTVIPVVPVVTIIYTLALLAPQFSLLAQASTGVKRFTSSAGLFVSYPSTWFPVGASKRQLTISSSRNRAEGMVSSTNQAEIAVLQDEMHTHNLLGVIAGYTKGATLISEKRISNTAFSSDSCTDLDELIVREPAVPREAVPRKPPDFRRTMYFCAVRERVLVTILTNIEGDRHQNQYRAVALEIARKIRVIKPPTILP